MKIQKFEELNLPYAINVFSKQYYSNFLMRSPLFSNNYIARVLPVTAVNLIHGKSLRFVNNRILT